MNKISESGLEFTDLQFPRDHHLTCIQHSPMQRPADVVVQVISKHITHTKYYTTNSVPTYFTNLFRAYWVSLHSTVNLYALMAFYVEGFISSVKHISFSYHHSHKDIWAINKISLPTWLQWNPTSMRFFVKTLRLLKTHFNSTQEINKKKVQP